MTGTTVLILEESHDPVDPADALTNRTRAVLSKISNGHSLDSKYTPVTLGQGSRCV